MIKLLFISKKMAHTTHGGETIYFLKKGTCNTLRRDYNCFVARTRPAIGPCSFCIQQMGYNFGQKVIPFPLKIHHKSTSILLRPENTNQIVYRISIQSQKINSLNCLYNAFQSFSSINNHAFYNFTTKFFKHKIRLCCVDGQIFFFW